MKKITTILAFILLIGGSVQAQIAERTRGQSVYVEVLGSGLLYSFNYDTRFTQRHNGIGGRAGIGYLAVDGARLTTLPLMVNYLFGHERHFFEVGIGTSVLIASEPIDFAPVGERNRASGAIGTMNLGYRLEPTDGGFVFRAGLTPFFGSSFFWPLWPQVSFGYAF